MGQNQKRGRVNECFGWTDGAEWHGAAKKGWAGRHARRWVDHVPLEMHACVSRWTGQAGVLWGSFVFIAFHFFSFFLRWSQAVEEQQTNWNVPSQLNPQFFPSTHSNTRCPATPAVHYYLGAHRVSTHQPLYHWQLLPVPVTHDRTSS